MVANNQDLNGLCSGWLKEMLNSPPVVSEDDHACKT